MGDRTLGLPLFGAKGSIKIIHNNESNGGTFLANATLFEDSLVERGWGNDGTSMIVGGGGAGSTGVGSAYPLPLQWPRYIPATVFT